MNTVSIHLKVDKEIYDKYKHKYILDNLSVHGIVSHLSRVNEDLMKEQIHE